jgi:hypothetical protein
MAEIAINSAEMRRKHSEEATNEMLETLWNLQRQIVRYYCGDNPVLEALLLDDLRSVVLAVRNG